MKRFAITILTVAVFFIGLGSIVDNVGAKFKSDEKALDLVRKARIAIGGDAAISSVQSMRIVGQTTRTVKFDGVERSERGETEIALQFPDKMMKSVQIGHDDGNGLVEKRFDKKVDVVVVRQAKEGQQIKVEAAGQGDGSAVARKIIIRKDDGTVQEITGDEAAKFIAKEDHPGLPGAAHTITLKKNADGTVEQVNGGDLPHVIVRKADGTGGNATFTSRDGKTFNFEGHDVVMERSAGGVAGGSRDNELLRTTLGLLLTAPQGMDVSYTFGGESTVDGTDCNIVVAEFAGTSYKIFLGKSSNLPVMLSYSAPKMPMIFTRTLDPKAGEQPKELVITTDEPVVMARTSAPKTGEAPKDNVMFARTTKLDGGPVAEYSVKFSDYRAVNGVQLPYKWTTTVGGATNEVFDVTNYEINPANIAEKFQNNNVKVRLAKPVIDK
ncbi:MAG: hypothetical protein ABL999_08435 [Pyrinomonadaceae bacterium]